MTQPSRRAHLEHVRQAAEPSWFALCQAIDLFDPAGRGVEVLIERDC